MARSTVQLCELHEYARPANFAEPLLQYEEGLMASPADQGHNSPVCRAKSAAIRQERPRTDNRVRQLVAPVPTPTGLQPLFRRRAFGRAQLTEWIDHGVPWPRSTSRLRPFPPEPPYQAVRYRRRLREKYAPVATRQ